MTDVEVLKFGSSVLRSSRDLHVAVDEVYRRWRGGYRVLAVVSAFEGITDELIAEVADVLGTDCPEATAAYVATGEQRTAALLVGSLQNSGIPSRVIDPREIGLLAEGSFSESTPVRVDVDALDQLWKEYPVLVLPGFYGIDLEGRTVLFGRGGSDLSALFLAAALGAECRLHKDVKGVYDADPASSTLAHRFSALSWERAIQVAGPLIQSKALRYAQSRAQTFEVGRPNDPACTRVGHTHDEWAPPASSTRPIGIALVGCGTVGRGVYEAVRRYSPAFKLHHVVVREVERYIGVDHLTTDPSVAFDASVDVVIICTTGNPLAYPLIASALNAGKFVITANKAAVAAHGKSLLRHTRGEGRRLWYSATVVGALPALEILATLESRVVEIRGIINGTSGVVLDEWAAGKTRDDAIAVAQAAGFAEANPARDLSGRDSADKLALLVDAAFEQWVDPENIPTRGIETIEGEPNGYKLIARAARNASGVVASVAPEVPPPRSFLGQARGPENRVEIELESGEVVRLRGQGAGRWPTTVSVMGDLHEVARRIEKGRGSIGSSIGSTTGEPPIGAGAIQGRSRGPAYVSRPVSTFR
jgi:homoserine dehydrogenase